MSLFNKTSTTIWILFAVDHLDFQSSARDIHFYPHKWCSLLQTKKTMASTSSNPKDKPNTENLPYESTLQLAYLLRKSLRAQTQTNNNNLSIGIKLNRENNALSATLKHKAIGGRGLTHYRDYSTSSVTETTYER